MTALNDRSAMISLIDEATVAGARFCRACQIAGIDRRTYRRWLDTKTGEVTADKRPDAARPIPTNALKPAERQAILDCCQQPQNHGTDRFQGIRITGQTDFNIN